MRPTLTEVRVVLSDLDETLLGPDHRPGNASLELIPKVQELGLQLGVCTGRAPEAARPVAEQLGARYIISVNGARVEEHRGRVLAEALIPGTIMADMVARLKPTDFPFYVMSPDGYFSLGHGPLLDQANKVRGTVPPPLPESMAARPAYKLMALGAAVLYEDFLSRYGSEVAIVYHPDYLEIGPLGIDKSWGAAQLAAHLGLQPEAFLGAGDALNDVGLLRWAGVGVAMGDAMPAVRAAADWVVGPHTHDGMSEVFRALLEDHADRVLAQSSPR